MDKFYTLIKRTSTTPRWVILVLDILICIFSISYANVLRFNFDLSAISQNHFFLQVLSITLINALFFRLFHTYEGIIRISGVNEGLRCITAVFYSFFLLSVCNIICSTFGWPNLVPTSILIIYFFTASFLIFGYRTIIKNLYRQSIKHQASMENVLIVGGAAHATLLKRAMEQVSNYKYNVVGFIEENERMWGRKIDNIKIYSFNQIKNTSSLNVKLLFLADENIRLDLKNSIVDYCLAQNIPVKVIPPVQNWIQGQLNIRQIADIKIEDLLNRPAIHLATNHVQAFIKEKVVLITGAAGSIGSEIARQVAAVNPTMLILCDQTETALYELDYELEKNFGKRSNTKIYIGDVRDKKAMRHLFKSYQPQVVFHAAAYKHVPMMEKHPAEAIRNNVLGTKVLADLAEEYGTERFVFISTDKAINPTNVMGASKRIAEMYVEGLQNRQRKLLINAAGRVSETNGIRNTTKFIITRFGNVLGSNGSVIPRFKEQINRGGPVTVTHPDIIRYFMTIPEACSLVLEAGTMGKGGEVFLFDMGEPVKILDLANKMIRLSGLIPGRDVQIEFTGLRPGEKLYEELLNKQEEVIPTHHKKIMIANARGQEYETVSTSVSYLIELAIENKDIEVVRQMKYIVPEYKSKNSAYEELDKEVTLTESMLNNYIVKEGLN